MSLDRSDLINNKPLEVWILYQTGAQVKIKCITEDIIQQMNDRCLDANGKTDRRKLRAMIAEEAIIDWKGFMNGKKELVCNKENIRKLIERLPAFANWVETMATEYTILQKFRLVKANA